MYEDVPLAYINIHKGGQYSEGWNLVDEAGDPLVASDGWTGKCEIRTAPSGTLIATFASPLPSPSAADGLVTFDEFGNVTLSMTAAETATLTSTFNSAGNSTVFVGDLEVWQSSTPAVKWHAIDFRVRIYPEVTTS